MLKTKHETGFFGLLRRFFSFVLHFCTHISRCGLYFSTPSHVTSIWFNIPHSSWHTSSIAQCVIWRKRIRSVKMKHENDPFFTLDRHFSPYKCSSHFLRDLSYDVSSICLDSHHNQCHTTLFTCCVQSKKNIRSFKTKHECDFHFYRMALTFIEWPLVL